MIKFLVGYTVLFFGLALVLVSPYIGIEVYEWLKRLKNKRK